MMGTKERQFAPLVQVSLEQLVPHDHFYRHVERTLDLSFVREFVKETYAGGGRPSIDPVVFFKLQLIMRSKGGVDRGYHTHYVVDGGGRARIIVAALVTPSEVMDNQPMLD